MSVGLSGQVLLCHDNSRLGNKKLQCYSQEEKQLIRNSTSFQTVAFITNEERASQERTGG